MDTIPDAYKEGSIEFYGRDFIVTPDVLIPRIETAMIIDAVKKLGSTSPSDEVTIFDVGTGSGILAVTLACLFPHAHITAIDISEAALQVARRNAKKYKVEKKIHFLKNDLLTGISEAADIIVTNLPYVPTDRIHTLDASVKDHEPHLALDGGKEGLDLYKKLLSQLKVQAITPSYLFAEIDEGQGSPILTEVHRLFPNAQAKVTRDFANLERLLSLSF